MGDGREWFDCMHVKRCLLVKASTILCSQATKQIDDHTSQPISCFNISHLQQEVSSTLMDDHTSQSTTSCAREARHRLYLLEYGYSTRTGGTLRAPRKLVQSLMVERTGQQCLATARRTAADLGPLEIVRAATGSRWQAAGYRDSSGCSGS